MMFDRIFRRIRKRKQKRNLRQFCYEKYGAEYAEKLDAMAFGEPIGNFQETVEFLVKLNEAKKELENEDIR